MLVPLSFQIWWLPGRVPIWKPGRTYSQSELGTFLLSVCFQRLPEDVTIFVLLIKLPRLSPASQWKDSTVNLNKSACHEMVGDQENISSPCFDPQIQKSILLSLQIRVSKILWTFWAYKMKFTKRLLWKQVKSPTSFLSLEVAEGREHIPCALCDYNVVRLLFLCGSLTSLKDNSKRSSKDMLSSGRISQGITLNDSFPLDPCKKLITFHMQIDTPQVYCLASFINSTGISELLPSVPGYVRCYGAHTNMALFFWPCYLLGRVQLVKQNTDWRDKTELSK